MASDILLKVGSIVLLLGGLIFVHELGHFVAAKLLGVKVVKFSIGFGPRLFGFRRGETEYLLALLPLGGYVKMAGDEPGAEVAPEDRGRGFLEAPPWKRFVIAFAGPAANLAFPVVIYFALALAQNGSAVPGPTLGTIMPGSAADRAGLQAGDRVVSVTVPGRPSEPVRYFSDLRQLVAPRAGERIDFTVDRGGRAAGRAGRPGGREGVEPGRDRHPGRHRGLPGMAVGGGRAGPAWQRGPARPVRPGGPRRRRARQEHGGPRPDPPRLALRAGGPRGAPRGARPRSGRGRLHLRAREARHGSHLRRREARLPGGGSRSSPRSSRRSRPEVRRRPRVCAAATPSPQ